VGSGTAVEVERFVAAVALAGALRAAFEGSPKLVPRRRWLCDCYPVTPVPAVTTWSHPGTRANRTDGTLGWL